MRASEATAGSCQRRRVGGVRENVVRLHRHVARVQSGVVRVPRSVVRLRERNGWFTPSCAVVPLSSAFRARRRSLSVDMAVVEAAGSGLMYGE